VLPPHRQEELCPQAVVEAREAELPEARQEEM
jgi:hypothetical protein